jgi:DNA mismatch repair ATPase MutS
MFVTAEAYRARMCQGVFTHFTREEDASMTSGRLDEELSRMSAIADLIAPRCLMLGNESFAATNGREGSEIGHQVVGALLEAEIEVFFVTHQFDFADSFYRRAEHERSSHHRLLRPGCHRRRPGPAPPCLRNVRRPAGALPRQFRDPRR